MFDDVRATEQERGASLPGDDVVPDADVVMDRAFPVPGTPEQVWPWLAQLGKRRAGWYLPRRAEWLVPVRRRALRRLEPRWGRLEVGEVIPDYGGRDESFTVASIDPPHHLVYRSRRGRTDVSWAIVLQPAGATGDSTRVRLRLRMGPVRRVWLARTGGELIDVLTIAGMAAGLRERLVDTASAKGPPRTTR